MNAPVTVLKAPQPESVPSALVSEELARFVGDGLRRFGGHVHVIVEHQHDVALRVFAQLLAGP